jgi:hypothetical protein
MSTELSAIVAIAGLLLATWGLWRASNAQPISSPLVVLGYLFQFAIGVTVFACAAFGLIVSTLTPPH